MASSKDTPAPEIMNVREIIECAFGDFKGNTVNFKLIQTVLFLIARQMRLLERRVEVKLGPLSFWPSETTLSVTEVKIHAMQEKKIGVAGAKSAGGARAKPGDGTGPKTGIGAKAKPSHGAGAKSGSGAGTDAKGKKDSTHFTTDKSSTDKTSSSEITTSTDKSTSGKRTLTTTDDKDITSSSKTTSTSKEPSSKTTSTSKEASTKTTSTSKETSKSDEQQLNTAEKRADSFEEAKKSPTPMASVTSLQAQHEKLLVVKQVPSSEARNGDSLQDQKRTPQISVVTQEQFQQVANAVRQLEKKLLPPGTPAFPQNSELMEQLRKGASLTDAMAALQLSARLEATEKALTQMTSLVTELVKKTPGVTLDNETQTLVITDPTAQGQFGAGATPGDDKTIEGSQEPSQGPQSRPALDGPKAVGVSESDHGGKGKSRKTSKGPKSITASSAFATDIPTSEVTETAPATNGASEADSQTTLTRSGYITFSDLCEATRQMKAELFKILEEKTKSTTINAENAYKLSSMLEAKIDTGAAINARMAGLETAVKQYADQINALDTDLSSQMTMYQEQLTQMQHDLEVGLDSLNEALGNSNSDTVAVAELHGRFNSLQVDFENMASEQKILKDNHYFTALDLDNLWKQIESLRETKSDREEVADALRDKAGIGELNGLVSIEQFEAVRGDFGKRIRAAFDKFNTQEISWQKSIEAVIRVFNEKADQVQVQSLKDDINKHLNKFKDRIKIIADIVGEPKSAMVFKKVFRDTACLSCGSPAHMDMEEPNKFPALPKFPSTRQPAEGAEAEPQTKGGGDHGICYPGLPIPHQRDPRSHVCKRYCGGSHTVLTEGINRAPQAMTLKPLGPLKTTPGTDGKSYLVDEPKLIPCLACNKPKPEPPSQDGVCDECACSRGWVVSL